MTAIIPVVKVVMPDEFVTVTTPGVTITPGCEPADVVWPWSCVFPLWGFADSGPDPVFDGPSGALGVRELPLSAFEAFGFGSGLAGGLLRVLAWEVVDFVSAGNELAPLFGRGAGQGPSSSSGRPLWCLSIVKVETPWIKRVLVVSTSMIVVHRVEELNW
jgi:hypothetical protein